MFKSKNNLEFTSQEEDRVNLVDKLFAVYQEKNNLADELIIANRDYINLTDELVIATRENSYLVNELIIANKERNHRADELVIANEEKSDRADELIIAKKEKIARADELVIANEEKINRADELAIAKQEKSARADELAIANEEKNNRADELAIANEEKSDRADELAIAKQEKSDRADELVIANEEKSDRADELVIANEEKSDRADELAIANEEKSDRADELVIAKREKSDRADELVIAKQDKIDRADELVIANEEKSDRADELVIANEEKSDRADELAIAKQEKSDRADELAIAKQDKSDRANELAIAKQDKSNRADELAIANKELAYQNKEKDKRADELIIANKELAYQNKEKDKRANELIIANNEKVFLLRKLQLSQKMEALGKLTGGISHEYNNMLGIISGYSQLIKLMVAKDSELTKYANEIQHAGQRAAKLTSKLLSFSQEKSANADAINVNFLLKRLHDMLQKTLTISINLVYKLCDDLWHVWLDGSDMEDAILNLCINAMHAMNEHGKLTIETKNKLVNQKEAKDLNITSGEYILLSFTDTGCGFDEKIKDKIFDPFFTTKGELGTGLGLSIVYSFVQNSGGGVDVDSIEGAGTQFRFYFPRHHDEIIDIKTKKQGLNNFGFTEKGNILLVDDEPSLLAVTSKILSSSGYNVFCAKDATIALSILERESINILISDVIMPNIDGYELATIVKEKYPDIKIQIVSGFAGNRNTDMMDLNLQKNILRKPVDSGTLLSRVRELAEQIDPK